MNELLRDGSPNRDPLEDEFIHGLIEAVVKNPCVYNRYDPLHKAVDYKHEIWKEIGVEIGYDGQPVELERKWKHMRDKYVRLRKADKHKQPIKKTNKWYNYYHKMSFLDPFVEHRNRKSQKGNGGSPEPFDEESSPILEQFNMKDILKQDNGSVSPISSSTSSGQLHLDSPTCELTEDKNKLLLQILAENANRHPSLLPSTTAEEWIVSSPPPEPKSSRKRKPIPKQILQEETSSPLEKKMELMQEGAMMDDDQVSFFIRSIAKTLVEMDRQKFAMARIEISKVLYNIEFGAKKQNPSDKEIPTSSI